MIRYQGRHRSQYATGASARLRSMGCGPTSLANALRCATGGAIDLTGDQVLAKVVPTEEQIPGGGWTLGDVQLAASRIPGAPPFAVRRGRWSEVTSALAAGLGVVLQGDSDQFPSGCSGAFDGDHCIFVHPDTVSGRQSTGDPICPDWRTETLAVLQAYAEKLSGLDVRFGAFTSPIPPADTTPPESDTEEPAMPAIRNPKPADGTFTTGPNGATSVRVRDGADGPVGPNEPQTVVMQGTLEGLIGDAWFTEGPGELYAFPKAHGTFVAANPGTGDPVEARRAQYDVDARALLGPRP